MKVYEIVELTDNSKIINVLDENLKQYGAFKVKDILLKKNGIYVNSKLMNMNVLSINESSNSVHIFDIIAK